jgi:CRISPR-associated protein Csm3
MFAKFEITGTLEVKTGLHIGGNGAFAAIGAVDSPVIRDVRSDDPIIPGSSLKGKMRTLLAKYYNDTVAAKPDDDSACIKGLFGSAKKGEVKTARLLFSDMFLQNKEELRNANIYRATEVKFENSINRSTAVATPRQLERVIRGAKFGLNLVYEYKDDETMLKDFELLQTGLRLLQYDYLGGSGSRGYGKVTFSDIEIDQVVGDDVDEDVLEQCRDMLANL